MSTKQLLQEIERDLTYLDEDADLGQVIFDIRRKINKELYALSTPEQPQMNWVKANKVPPFDSMYLCFIIKKEECGVFAKYQKVVTYHNTKWLTADGERVAYYQSLPPEPKTELVLLSETTPQEQPQMSDEEIEKRAEEAISKWFETRDTFYPINRERLIKAMVDFYKSAHQP